MPLPLMNHSAFAWFAQRTRIPTSARIVGFVSFGFVLVRVQVRTTHHFTDPFAKLITLNALA